MAHPSLTAALLRVMQSSSGISQPARLLHKACRWHTRITIIRIPETFQHAVSQVAKGMEIPTSLLRATLRALFSLVVCFAFAARRLRRTTPSPPSRIAIVQLYLKGVAHEPCGHRRFVAT